MNTTYKQYNNGKILLKIDKKTIGTVIVKDYDQPGLYISHLDVIEDFRNKGYGSKIMNDIILRAKNHVSISLHVSVNNHLAIKFYKRFGFFIACTTIDKKDKHYLMVKEL